jgi:Rrf2 family protein
MKMNEGVEWAVHCCLNLSWVEPQRVTAAKLAAFYDLPTAYLNKQLQALVRAGIVSSTSGPRGGFQLARPAHKITLMDVVVAIEGPEQAFRCTEIRQDGPAGGLGTVAGFRKPCAVAAAMRKAETAWRGELAAVTVADLMATVETRNPNTNERVRRWFDTARV